MRKLKSPLAMFLFGGTLIALLFFCSFYLEMKNNLRFFARQTNLPIVAPSPSPVPTPSSDECAIEKGNLLAVVAYFEQLRSQRDPRQALALFTNPISTADKKDYQTLLNQDVKLAHLSYQVTAGPVKSLTNFCIVMVTEQRDTKATNLVLVLSKQDNKWLIEQYQSLDSQIKKGKYSGWLMESNR
jgi:hypothetical protein